MDQEPIRPSVEQLALLDPFERFSFHLNDFINSNPRTKAASQLFLRSVGMTWVYYCTRSLVHLLGADNLKRLSPSRGLLLTSNHRSFFDQYVIACYLFRITKLLERIYFPVRAEFWYEKPLGMLVSLIMSAFCMYPPVFRAQHKREFNSYGVKRLVQLLEQPGNVIGMHPEGTRNKGPDPYALLPAQPGIGKLILRARPTVLPLFINGLGNDLRAQVQSNFDKSGQPVVIVVGEPLDLERFFERKNTLRCQKEVADLVLAEIGRLGERERTYREGLPPGPAGGPLFLP